MAFLLESQAGPKPNPVLREGLNHGIDVLFVGFLLSVIDVVPGCCTEPTQLLHLLESLQGVPGFNDLQETFSDCFHLTAVFC